MTERPTADPGDRWEVGGEFHRMIPATGDRTPWITPYRLFGLATHTVIAVWKALGGTPTRRLHVPDYFCPEVVTAWEHAGIPIATFRDDPRWSEPDWSSLSTTPDDLVLAVDLFGVRSGEPWSDWHRAHPAHVLVEDHSHDPASTWARGSTADYAFASLRKTFPISDGAILWSPRGHPLPDVPPTAAAGGSAVKLAAMVLKTEYLAGGAADHGAVRALQLRGERELLSDPPAPMAHWNLSHVADGTPEEWRRRRADNVRALLDRIQGIDGLRPLFSSWPAGHCPFNAILEFDDETARDACRAALIAERVYPPVHWAQPAEADPRARDLAARILTIPVDQRYDEADVGRVADILVHSRVRGAR